MKFATRSTVLILVLALGLAAFAGMRLHVGAAGPPPVTPLAKPLEEFPKTLGPWRGFDQEIDPRYKYADRHLQRAYVLPSRSQSLTLWMVYSKTGEDRGHHPQVCMAVAGRPEDESARKTIDAPGHKAPIQQFRFGRPGNYSWVYYWHYTLPPEENDDLSAMQRLSQRLKHRSSSITIQIFAPEVSEGDAEFARRFVRLVDAAVQSHVGPRAVRGSHRQPVSVVDNPVPVNP